MTSTQTWISRVKVELKHLAVGDVVEVPGWTFRYYTIREIAALKDKTRTATVEDQHGDQQVVELENNPNRLYVVISGSKLMAARRNRNLVKYQGNGWVWKGG